MKVTMQLLVEKSKLVVELSQSMANAHRVLLNMAPEQRREARKAYLASLSKEQGSVIQKLLDATTWNGLETSLKGAIRFVDQAQNIVLDPARMELVGRLKKWADEVGVSISQESEDWFSTALKDSGQAALNEIGGKLESLEVRSRALGDPLMKFFRKMVSNELGQTKSLEKNNENACAWIDRATQAILQGIELQKVFVPIKEGIEAQYKGTPRKEVVSRFVSTAESSIERVGNRATSFETAGESWGQTRKAIDSDWKLLAPKLDPIAEQYGALKTFARPLVTKEIGEWDIETLGDVVSRLSSLSQVVGQIIGLQDSSGSIEAHVSSLKRKDKSALVGVDQLAGTVASLSEAGTKAKLSSTLVECRDCLKTLSQNYERWETSVEEARRQWLAETGSWLSIVKRESIKVASNLEKEGGKLGALRITKDRFGLIVDSYMKVRSLVEEARKELHEKLPDDQLNLLAAVASLEAEKGSVYLGDLDRKLGGLKPDQASHLLDLAKKQLLSVRISTKEENVGA